VIKHPNLLVGTETGDDAAVYRLNDETALVLTVDFFTPITDDPFEFGSIAAANSLSDVYAMGARPLFALSVVGFPARRLPLRALDRILEGATEVAREAGIAILGGHTIEDPEPKFGLAVTGRVHPQHILTNRGARVGDYLVLTKPLGTGILATALKSGLADADTEKRLVATMRALNKTASELAIETGAHACTDVTGFGFLGHLREMAVASGLEATVELPAVPFLERARELAAAGVAPGLTRANLEHLAAFVDWPDAASSVDRVLLTDAQTSGGLLIALGEDRVEELVRKLHARDLSEARVVGRFTGRGAGRIRVS